MPEGFDKTGHGLTDIVIAWDEFKPVFHSVFFWEQECIYLLCTRMELKALHHGWGLCQIFKENLE